MGHGAAALSRNTGAHPVGQFFQFALLGMLASGYLAVLSSGALDPPTIVLPAAAIVWRGLMTAGYARRGWPAWLPTVLTLAYIGFYPLDYLYFSQEFLRATVHLVFFLVSVQVLTAQTTRGYLFLKLMALVEILAASILSTGPSFLVFLGAFLLCGVAALSAGEIRRSMEGRQLLARARVSGFRSSLSWLCVFVFVTMLGVTAFLFFVLPRTARAAFQHLASQRFHVPGFSGEVNLGQIGEIRQSSLPVMHVRLLRGKDPLQVKWRGSSLKDFDGRRWYNASDSPGLVPASESWVRLASDEQRRRDGVRILYEVQRRSEATDALFFAGRPEFVRVRGPLLFRRVSGTYSSPAGFGGVLAYRAQSLLEDASAPQPADVAPLPPDELAAFLRSPVLDPRIGELAAQWTAGIAGEAAKARAIAERLRNDFGYTTQLLDQPVGDPIAHFLFERKKGHCEYFASALALMLRTQRIPSRVVIGFQSGVFNPLSGWYVIRASDAHSWVEAWLPGHGWTEFDPTPPDPNYHRTTFWWRLALYADAADVFWQNWILGYDFERQLQLAERMGRSGRSFSLNWWQRVRDWRTATSAQLRDAGVILAGLAAMLVLLALAAYLSRRMWSTWQDRRRARQFRMGQAQAADAALLYERLLRNLSRRGIDKPAWMTPLEFAGTVPAAEDRRLVAELTHAYNALRFGKNVEAAARVVEMLEELERRA